MDLKNVAVVGAGIIGILYMHKNGRLQSYGYFLRKKAIFLLFVSGLSTALEIQKRITDTKVCIINLSRRTNYYLLYN